MINKWTFEPNQAKQHPSPPEAQVAGAPWPVPPQDKKQNKKRERLRSLVFSSICGFVPSKNTFYHIPYSFQVFTITVFASFLQGHGLSWGPWHRERSGIYRHDCTGRFNQDSGRCPARKHHCTSTLFESRCPLLSFPAPSSFLSPSPRCLRSLCSASPPNSSFRTFSTLLLLIRWPRK